MCVKLGEPVERSDEDGSWAPPGTRSLAAVGARATLPSRRSLPAAATCSAVPTTLGLGGRRRQRNRRARWALGQRPTLPGTLKGPSHSWATSHSSSPRGSALRLAGEEHDPQPAARAGSQSPRHSGRVRRVCRAGYKSSAAGRQPGRRRSAAGRERPAAAQRGLSGDGK
jgi:hypothetical protein